MRTRNEHPGAFAAEGDFNEQLHDALRKSPWWMISLAIHVLVVAIVLALAPTATQAAPVPTLEIGHLAPPEEPEIEEIEPIHDPLVDLLKNPEDPLEIDQQPEEAQVDVDSTFDEPSGETLGDTHGFDAGPSNGGEIGVGGPPGGAFPGRGSGKDGGGDGGGGDRPFDDALDAALEWLAAHQSPHGGWEAAGFVQWCNGQPAKGAKPDGAGKQMYDSGVTGLALCAFLGAGYTNRGNHRFNRVVARGLRYLINVQDPEGCFGPRSTQQYIYNHATAALAMVEAYAMTASPIFRGPAQRALEFISLSRNPYSAWRYGIKPGDNDTSVSGWMMMAYKSARITNKAALKRGKAAPLSIDEGIADGLTRWLDKVTDPDTGRVGYLTRGTGSARPAELVDAFPAEKSEAMTAVGVLARVFNGVDPSKDPLIAKGAQLMGRRLPVWNTQNGSIDMYYWYYATLAMYQMGGKNWRTWKQAMKPAMVDSQRRDGTPCSFKGSWDPAGPWGADGGRVYSTAIMALCLEVFYRYDRVFGLK